MRMTDPATGVAGVVAVAGGAGWLWLAGGVDDADPLLEFGCVAGCVPVEPLSLPALSEAGGRRLSGST